MKNTFCVALAFLLIACGVPQADYDKLKSENLALQARVDSLENGEDRLMAIVNNSYENGEYDKARKSIHKLREIHPQSEFHSEMNKLMDMMDAKDAAEYERIVKEERESERLANLNNTGMWSITYYTDEFGEPTKTAFIWNKNNIRGVFSNTATQNSKLDVRIFIEAANEVDIKLYEYAGRNPVKAYRKEQYRVALQDSKGGRHKLSAINYSDRLSFGPKHSAIITSALKKGGQVKFSIHEVENPINNYAFTIQDAKYFDNSLRLLSEK